MNLDAGVELPIDACEGPCKCVLSGIQSRQRRTSAHEHDAVLEESLGCRGGIENPIVGNVLNGLRAADIVEPSLFRPRFFRVCEGSSQLDRRAPCSGCGAVMPEIHPTHT